MQLGANSTLTIMLLPLPRRNPPYPGATDGDARLSHAPNSLRRRPAEGQFTITPASIRVGAPSILRRFRVVTGMRSRLRPFRSTVHERVPFGCRMSQSSRLCLGDEAFCRDLTKLADAALESQDRDTCVALIVILYRKLDSMAEPGPRVDQHGRCEPWPKQPRPAVA